MFEKLCEIIAEQFDVDVDTITADTAFEADLQADSVDLVDLSMALEDEFGMEEMEEDDIAAIVTVGDLYKYMQEHLDTRAHRCRKAPRSAGLPFSKARRQET